MNRKSYAIYGMVSFQVTLSDPWSGFQTHNILQRHVIQKWYKIELYLQWNKDVDE